MHIVVCMKQVPDATEVRIDPKTNTLQRAGVPSIINPYDVHAIEAALTLKDKYGGKVTILTMGPAQAEESIKKAISLGADEAVLLSDRGFAGSDTLATSYILAQAIEKIKEKGEVDLVLCGKQAIDGDTAQVGPGIAVRLGIPQLTFVMKIEGVDLESKEITVQRKLEGGQLTVKTRLPALLTVEKSLNEIRYATLPNMIKAAKYKVNVWGKNEFELKTEEIGLKGSPTTVSKIFAPPQRAKGEILAGGDENPVEVVKELVKRLMLKEIVADK